MRDIIRQEEGGICSLSPFRSMASFRDGEQHFSMAIRSVVGCDGRTSIVVDDVDMEAVSPASGLL